MTQWTAACQASLSFTVFWSLLRLMFIESVMLSNHLILCHPLLLPSILPSISLFQWVGCSHQVAKYRSFIFSSSPSNEYSELASFRIDWSDLLAVQGILKSSSSTRVRKHQFFGTQSSFKEGNGNPLQYSYLENSMERGAWWAAVHGVAQSRTWLKQLSSSSSLLYGSTFTSVYEHWKKHGFDYMNLCQQSDVSAF